MSTKDIYSLPFDQFSRQFVVSDVVENCIKPRLEQDQISIIDLGGHKGQTKSFQPNDNVTILDVYDESYEGYVKGDATGLEFKDSSFDFSYSFDVFEHIPRIKRQKFIDEALRVSKHGAFIALPVDDDLRHVSQAEKDLNAFHKNLFGDNHPWLKEHIDYKIPTIREIEKLIPQRECSFIAIPSNGLGDWSLMQSAIFLAAGNTSLSQPVQLMNKWFNKQRGSLEQGSGIYYRQVFFISKDNKLVKRVEKYLASKEVKAQASNKVFVNQATLNKLLETIALHEITVKHDFKAQTTRLNAEIAAQFTHNKKLTNELKSVYSSKSWFITKPIRIGAKLFRKR